MGENYYEHPNRNLPDIVQCHVENLIYYIAVLFFKQEFIEDPQKAANRILISDVNAGSDISLGDAMEYFRTMFDYLPFVVYNPGMSLPPRDYGKSASHTLSLQYIEELNSYIRAFPMELEVQFVAFFNDALDHRRAIQLLSGDEAVLTRLLTPVMFDNKEVKLPMTLTFELDKGDLAGEFEQYLVKNRIWNFPFTIKCRYYEYILDDILSKEEYDKLDPDYIYQLNKAGASRVSKVDDLLIRIWSRYNKNNPVLLYSETIPDTLKITSTYPKNNQTGVSKQSNIDITFSSPVMEKTITVDSVKIKPFIEVETYFDITNTILTLHSIAASGMLPNTKYEVIVDISVKDGNNQSLEQEYSFTFKTIS